MSKSNFITCVILAACVQLFFSCDAKKPQAEKKEIATVKHIPVRYAKGFTIDDYGSYIKLTVRNPLDTLIIISEYNLIRNNAGNKNSKNKINIPVQDIACISTTHLGFLEALNETGKLTGFSGTKYIYNEQVRALVKGNKIKEIGEEGELNYELITQLHPDIFMCYNMGNPQYDNFQKLQSLQIQTVINNEYLELTPLGEAEWIKFVAAFFDEEAKADSVFSQVEKEYNELKNLVLNQNSEPLVFTSLPFKAQWTMPGGKSFAANYLKDAGGNYIFSDNTLTGNFPVSLEEIIVKARNADYWLNTGAANKLKDIVATDNRLKVFDAYKKGNVFNNNNRVNEQGGNDYWESGVINPQKVLADLIKIFYPQLMSNREFIYYKKLE